MCTVSDRVYCVFVLHVSEWLPVPSTSCRMAVVEVERAARSHPPRPSMASLRACRWPSTTALVPRLLRSDRQLAVKLTILYMHCINITHGTLVWRVRIGQELSATETLITLTYPPGYNTVSTCSLTRQTQLYCMPSFMTNHSVTWILVTSLMDFTYRPTTPFRLTLETESGLVGSNLQD